MTKFTMFYLRVKMRIIAKLNNAGKSYFKNVPKNLITCHHLYFLGNPIKPGKSNNNTSILTIAVCRVFPLFNYLPTCSRMFIYRWKSPRTVEIMKHESLSCVMNSLVNFIIFIICIEFPLFHQCKFDLDSAAEFWNKFLILQTIYVRQKFWNR